MTVLVTGATGFVGSWLVRKLIQDGHRVKVLHRTNSSLEELKSLSFDSCIGDVTDPHSLRAATEGVETVFHLAGVVGYSKAMLPMMEKVNVQGTKHVVDILKEKKDISLIYMSSVTAIGAGFNQKQILNEESPFNVSHLKLGYFDTKRAAENLVRMEAKAGRIHAVCLNPSTIYGPADAKKGSRKVQLKVARGKFPFYTSGGVSVISVHDVIQGLLAAWQKGRSGERYILSGENLTIHELFNRIAKEAGVKPPGHYLPNPVVHMIGKVGDIMEAMGKKGPLNSENAWTSTLFHWFDNSKARAELGLNPRPAQFALHESVQWMKDHGLLNEGAK